MEKGKTEKKGKLESSESQEMIKEKVREEQTERKQKQAEEQEKDKKIRELTETLQRLQAEFENYRKYIEKQYEGVVRYSNEELIKKLLPILDSFELALKNTSNKEEFINGIKLIFSQLYQLLESEGVQRIECLGEKFDPYKHEVLLTEESDKDEGIILEELQKGYTYKGKVIRHSKVKISKKKKKE